MSASDTASTTTAPRLRAAWDRVVAPLARMTRYHGIWGFGVNLLRNLPLRHKAWIVAVGVGLMLSLTLVEATRLRWQEWANANAALDGAAELRAFDRLRAAALALRHAAFVADNDGVRDGIAPALAQEATAYDAARAALAAQLAREPQLQRVVALLDTRRAELLAVGSTGAGGANAKDGKDSKTSASGVVGSTAATGPQAGTSLTAARLVAARRYVDAMEPLRYELMLNWSHTLDSDMPTRVLRDGLVNAAGDLQAPLHRLLTQAQASGAVDLSLPGARPLAERLLEVRLVLALARPSYDHARALLPDQAALLDAALLDVQRALDLVQGVVQAQTQLQTQTQAQLQTPSPPVDTLTPVDAIAAVATATTTATPTPNPSPGRSELAQRASRALAAVDSLGVLGLNAMQQRLQTRVDTLRQLALVEGGLLLACMLLTIYLLVCTYKVLAGGLSFLCHQVDELGRGNLGIRPNGHGQDEIGRALRVLGHSATQMASLFQAVTHGVAAVSHASRVVAAGNAGLSERTAEIRTSISSVSDSTQSFSGAMDRCNDAVDRASDHVRAMRGESQRCRKAMGSLQERMRTLQRKSREIEQVVGMVEAVAYQTRLLAINASVEAARAGPAGKGFAVVAQEVRALATRSQGASQRIRDIIGSSIGEIDAGHQMSERLGQALVRSDTEVEAASGVIGEMVGLVRASQTQSVEVLGITRRVDDAIADNARLVQQLSAASAELREEGDTLKRSVQHFEFG